VLIAHSTRIGSATLNVGARLDKSLRALPNVSYEIRKRLCDGRRTEILALSCTQFPGATAIRGHRRFFREKLLYLPSELARVVS
jgi:hypothetical protein